MKQKHKAKLSVRSLCFGSVLVLLAGVTLGDAIQPQPLKQGDEGNPALIAAWLKTNAVTADKTRAEQFFKFGLKEKKRGAWGPAGKGFGASLLFYPSPHALSEYAYVRLRGLGEIRAREKTFSQYKQSDLASVEPIYRSVLAADSVLNTLNATEKEQTRQNADCLAAFVQSAKMQANCRPLQMYGLTSE